MVDLWLRGLSFLSSPPSLRIVVSYSFRSHATSTGRRKFVQRCKHMVVFQSYNNTKNRTCWTEGGAKYFISLSFPAFGNRTGEGPYKIKYVALIAERHSGSTFMTGILNGHFKGKDIVILPKLCTWKVGNFWSTLRWTSNRKCISADKALYSRTFGELLCCTTMMTPAKKNISKRF